MQKRFWRRVWVWDLDASRWNVLWDDELLAFDVFQCEFGSPSWCNQPQPYVYEQWWSFTAGTIGGSEGRWNYVGARVNWGVNPNAQ